MSALSGIARMFIFIVFRAETCIFFFFYSLWLPIIHRKSKTKKTGACN